MFSTRTFVLLALMAAMPAHAVPMQLVHTGRLFDNVGLPLTGTHTLTLSLYDDGTTTTSVWQDTISVPFDNGFFSVELGTDTNNPLDDVVFDGNALYIGLAIDAGTELPQRQRVVSVPYAYRAGVAGGVDGGIVDATEVYVNGNLVLDSAGRVVGVPTLDSLSCGPDEVPLFDGNFWGCNPRQPDWSDVKNVPAGLLDGIDADTLDTLGCSDTDIARYDLTNGWACSTDLVLTEADVEGFITNQSIDLAVGSRVGGQPISTGPHYTDTDVNAVIGALDDTNPVNHARYSDSEAVAAMGSSQDTNDLNHSRYDDTEAIAAMGSVANTNPLNHLRFTEGQAITAMGSEANNNALNHARYQDFEAVNAVGPHLTAADARTAMGVLGDTNPLNHVRYTNGEALSAMGAKASNNPLNHDRYSGAEALADLGPHFTSGDAIGAMGPSDITNSLNHPRYTDSEAVTAMGTRGNSNALNHDRFGASDAVTAMGAKLSTNPLNHDRYTNADAQAAVGPHLSTAQAVAAVEASPVDLASGSMVNGTTISTGPHSADPLGSLSCTDGQVPAWNTGAWACADRLPSGGGTISGDLTVNGGAIINNGGRGAITHNVAQYFTSDSGNEYVHLQLPPEFANTDNSSHMFHIQVVGYSYGTSEVIDLTFVGYKTPPSNGGWIRATSIRDVMATTDSAAIYHGTDNNMYLRFRTGNHYYLTFSVHSMYVGNGVVMQPGDITVVRSASLTL